VKITLERVKITLKRVKITLERVFSKTERVLAKIYLKNGTHACEFNMQTCHFHTFACRFDTQFITVYTLVRPIELSREWLSYQQQYVKVYEVVMDKAVFYCREIFSRVLRSKKYILWVLKSNQKSCDLFNDQIFYVELKKVCFMGSEMQPEVIRAQKREIQISRVKKIFYLV
jgi:hypothetical protein